MSAGSCLVPVSSPRRYPEDENAWVTFEEHFEHFLDFSWPRRGSRENPSGGGKTAKRGLGQVGPALSSSAFWGLGLRGFRVLQQVPRFGVLRFLGVGCQGIRGQIAKYHIIGGGP